MHAALFAAHAERRQRAAVEQVDPVQSQPAASGASRRSTIMVEPGGSVDLPAVDDADDVQVGPAVVVAGLPRDGDPFG